MLKSLLTKWVSVIIMELTDVVNMLKSDKKDGTTHVYKVLEFG